MDLYIKTQASELQKELGADFFLNAPNNATDKLRDALLTPIRTQEVNFDFEQNQVATSDFDDEQYDNIQVKPYQKSPENYPPRDFQHSNGSMTERIAPALREYKPQEYNPEYEHGSVTDRGTTQPMTMKQKQALLDKLHRENRSLKLEMQLMSQNINIAIETKKSKLSKSVPRLNVKSRIDTYGEAKDREIEVANKKLQRFQREFLKTQARHQQIQDTNYRSKLLVSIDERKAEVKQLKQEIRQQSDENHNRNRSMDLNIIRPKQNPQELIKYDIEFYKLKNRELDKK